MTSATIQNETQSVWDTNNPWQSIAHALQWWEGAPKVIGVPDEPPAPSFSVDGIVVQVRRVADLLGVACWGHQAVDPDIKESRLNRMRRGEIP